eukprot:c7666_g1_i1.p1 GENE.c7666_g1_i1~~c7666_g1_i1.p1  ORF type:complete len:232 (-),score=39.88 c7666_g1_i1:419-1114(-)
MKSADSHRYPHATHFSHSHNVTTQKHQNTQTMVSGHNKPRAKVVLLGSSGVGKTSLFSRFFDDSCSNIMLTSQGADCRTRVVNNHIVLEVWDTAGQERFRSISRFFAKGAHGYVFVYDITDAASFSEIRDWVELVDSWQLPSCNVKLLIGNKSDINDRAVSIEAGHMLATELGMGFIETSARFGSNVVEAFSMVGEQIQKKIEPDCHELSPHRKVTICQEMVPKKSSNCCK